MGPEQILPPQYLISVKEISTYPILHIKPLKISKISETFWLCKYKIQYVGGRLTAGERNHSVLIWSGKDRKINNGQKVLTFPLQNRRNKPILFYTQHSELK